MMTISAGTVLIAPDTSGFYYSVRGDRRMSVSWREIIVKHGG